MNSHKADGFTRQTSPDRPRPCPPSENAELHAAFAVAPTESDPSKQAASVATAPNEKHNCVTVVGAGRRGPADGISRVVCNFSCGAASACATKMALELYPERTHIVNAFVADEDPDNRRFLADCERWFGRPVTVLRDEKYGASAATVWRRRRFIVNRNGAQCSKVLKRDVLKAHARPGDTIVLGYTADEQGRLDRYIDANPSDTVWAPLVAAGLSKRDCLEMVARAGIELPLMYRLGYHNANCPKCPKGGEGYWNKIRRDFPDNFEEMASIQDALGPGSYFFRNRKTGERISLRMLNPHAGRFKDELPVECGAVCEMPDGPGDGWTSLPELGAP